ncbi:nuclease-related domain-containing protein [Bacillus massiliglaciei]|uniref:nuclease-related domain-containing protein n=1 Tax=Bacillus massiliglaciei TaxID=1816693 RepID=UPI000AFA571F|nr:nuclease-related domain-containing protein [Bacillus massiliglaciei]
MAQLIKLQDYVSRYEQDMYRYPSQYLRLKTQQWEKLKAAYLAGEMESIFQETAEKEEGSLEIEKESLFHRMTSKWRRAEKEKEPLPEENKPMEENPFSLHFSGRTANLEDLKKSFLNQLLRFQMKWASSTMLETSYIDPVYYLDEKLRFLLQRFPDTFLVLYKPVFLLKKAPVELDVIILTPTEIWCLAFLEAEENAAFTGTGERFWMKRHNQNEKRVLNPLLAVNRMEKIVAPLLKLYGVDLPIKKAVLSRNGYMDYPNAPFGTALLDKRSFPGWFQQLRGSSVPLKHQQLKAAQSLLEYCQTTSSSRGSALGEESFGLREQGEEDL